MAYEVVDFQDIQDAIREELKVQSSDTLSINRIKRVINQVYLQEIVPFHKWKWLEGTHRAIHKARYNTGTCIVTPESATVTLNTTPSVGTGSFAGKRFAVDGYNEIYIVSAHTAGSATVTLTSNYTGNLSATAGFKIWNDIVDLPTDCRETIGVWHNFHSKPMEGIGLQKFRKLSALNQRAEAYPSVYYTSDFYDPSTGDGELETDRYRRMYIYPSVNKTDVTLQIDYMKEISALDAAGDEPAMPVEDRVVLVYGALARLFKSINSDIEQSQLAKADYNAKLTRMSSKLEDSIDPPKLKPDSTYVKTRRAPRFSPSSHSMGGANGGSGYEAVTYLEDVTIAGATITANVTVNSGITIDGVDISALSTTSSDHIADTVGAHAASAISFTAAGNIAAADVQLALEELDADKVAGPATATDNAVVRFDSTSGKLIQDTSTLLVSDTGEITQATTTVIGILTSATLTDNIASPTQVLALPHATYNTAIIEYSMKRGTGNREVGHIYMINDGTTAEFTAAGASLGTLGVTLTADISGTDMRLLYITTSTGTDVTMQYRITKWAN